MVPISAFVAQYGVTPGNIPDNVQPLIASIATCGSCARARYECLDLKLNRQSGPVSRFWTISAPSSIISDIALCMTPSPIKCSDSVYEPHSGFLTR